jgi:hypothetical protein
MFRKTPFYRTEYKLSKDSTAAGWRYPAASLLVVAITDADLGLAISLSRQMLSAG